jgi:hypothetical protein
MRLKESHGLWPQIMAELCLPGMTFLIAYYGLIILQLRSVIRIDKLDSQGLTPEMVCVARVGFIVLASIVSLKGLEIQDYVCVVGLGSLKIQSADDELEHVDDVKDHVSQDKKTEYASL